MIHGHVSKARTHSEHPNPHSCSIKWAVHLPPIGIPLTAIYHNVQKESSGCKSSLAEHLDLRILTRTIEPTDAVVAALLAIVQSRGTQNGKTAHRQHLLTSASVGHRHLADLCARRYSEQTRSRSACLLLRGNRFYPQIQRLCPRSLSFSMDELRCNAVPIVGIVQAALRATRTWASLAQSTREKLGWAPVLSESREWMGLGLETPGSQE